MIVAKTVDLKADGREPVFDPPAILTERINFDRAVRVQHTEQILHGIGHGSLLCFPQTPPVGLASIIESKHDCWMIAIALLFVDTKMSAGSREACSACARRQLRVAASADLAGTEFALAALFTVRFFCSVESGPHGVVLNIPFAGRRCGSQAVESYAAETIQLEMPGFLAQSAAGLVHGLEREGGRGRDFAFALVKMK